MLAKAVLLIILFTGAGFIFNSAVNAQGAGFNINALVFDDLNSDGLQTLPEETLLADWTIEVYDTSWNLLSSTLSSGSSSINTITIDTSTPSYICITPQTSWSQTNPVSNFQPTDSSWDCFNYELARDRKIVYKFGVSKDSLPADAGTTIDNSSDKVLLPKNEGQVLGVVDSQLVNTGSPAYLTSIIGFSFIYLSVVLYKSSKAYKNRLADN